MTQYPNFIAGAFTTTGKPIPIKSPFDDREIGTMFEATPADVEAAVAGAEHAFESYRKTPSHMRAEILWKLAALLEARRAEFAGLITAESGKPIKFAEGEVTRTKMAYGDPTKTETIVGPVINDDAVARLENALAEARHRGAKIECGGTRNGRVFAPTVLTETKPDMTVECEEIFGPMVTITPYDDYPEALARVNRSKYGLQAGLFTRDLDRILQALDTLEVGGVMVNDTPMFRVDAMPYGGVKDSGFGREGLRYTIAEMTEIRLAVMNPAG